MMFCLTVLRVKGRGLGCIYSTPGARILVGVSQPSVLFFSQLAQQESFASSLGQNLPKLETCAKWRLLGDCMILRYNEPAPCLSKPAAYSDTSRSHGRLADGRGHSGLRLQPHVQGSSVNQHRKLMPVTILFCVLWMSSLARQGAPESAIRICFNQSLLSVTLLLLFYACK